MQQWDSKVMQIDTGNTLGGDLEKILREEGKKGWEPYSTLMLTKPVNSAGYVLSIFFKKPMEY